MNKDKKDYWNISEDEKSYWEQREKNPQNTDHLKGLGGWLIFAFIFLLFSVARSLDVINDAEILDNKFLSIVAWLFLLVEFSLIVLFFIKHKKFPILFICYLIFLIFEPLYFISVYEFDAALIIEYGSFEYDLMIPIKGKDIKISFDDWIFKQDDKIAINRATLKKFGFKVGELTVFFQKN